MEGFEDLKQDEIEKRRMEEFSKLRDNHLTIGEYHQPDGIDGIPFLQFIKKDYNIIKSYDYLKKKWDVKDLIQEQKEIRHIDGDLRAMENEKYAETAAERAHRRAAELGNIKNNAKVKDRKKEFAKGRKIINVKMTETLEAYNALKNPSLKDKLKYEKKIIDLNYEAREHNIKAMMLTVPGYEYDVKKNKMRKYYRRLRMYTKHLQEAGLTAKQKRDLEKERDKAKEKLYEVLGSLTTEEKHRFRWRDVDTAGAHEENTGVIKQEKDKKKRAPVKIGLTMDDINAAREAEYAPIREEIEKRSKTYDINEPARIKFVKTGVWDDKAGTDKEDKETVPVEGWKLGELEKIFTGFKITGVKNYTDEEFKTACEGYNKSYKENCEAIMNYKVDELRDRFLNSMGFQTQFDHDDFKNFLVRNIEGVDDNIRKFYILCLKHRFPAVMSDNGYMEVLDPSYKFAEVEVARQNVKYILRTKERFDYVKKTLRLEERGDSVYDSPALKSILDKGISKENFRAVVMQMRGMDRLIKKMVRSKFSRLSKEDVYKGVLTFLGDKAIFGDYKEIRDVVERYLNGISFTNTKAAKIEKDFEDSFASNVNGPFAERFKKKAEAYLCDRNEEWRGQNEYKRKEVFNMYLGHLGMMEDVLREVTDEKEFTNAQWKEFLNKVDIYVKKKVLKQSKNFTVPGTKEEKKEARAELKTDFEKIFKIVEKNVPVAEGEDLLTRTNFIEGTKPKKKTSSLQAEDYSYANIFRTWGFADHRTIVKALPDENLRNFLGDNLELAILRNPKLEDKFPFIKEIKGIDQLDSLSYAQFMSLVDFFKKNLTDHERDIDGILKNRNLNEEMRKNILMEIMRTEHNDERGVAPVISEELKKADAKTEVHKMRVLISLGQETEARDGKIRYRFEDMPDRDKSIIGATFGKGSEWLVQRVQRFDNASKVWKRIDKLGYYYSEAVKTWIYRMYNTEDPAASFQKFAEEMLKEDKVNKKSPIGYDVKIPEMFEIDPAVVKALKLDTDEAKKQFYREIKLAFQKNDNYFNLSPEERKKAENKSDYKNKMSATEFIREFAVCDCQDIIFGHKGIGQESFFIYNGKKNDPEYYKEMDKLARMALNADTRVERALEDYQGDPELHKTLKDKLLRIFIELDTEEARKGNILREKLRKIGEKKGTYSQNYLQIEKQHHDLTMKSVALQDEGKEDADLDSQVMALSDQLSDLGREIEILKREEKEVQKQIDDQNLLENEERRKNVGKRGFEDLDMVKVLLNDNIGTDGMFSDKICDTVKLYEERKALFSEYGKGELKPMWDRIMKNDDMFQALMDPSDQKALATVKSLHEKFAVLGTVLSEQYDYITDYFLEDNLTNYLNESTHDAKEIFEKMKGLNAKEQLKEWRAVLSSYVDEQLSSNKKSTKSMYENIEKSGFGLQKRLAKHIYNSDVTFNSKREKKNNKAEFRKWWFIKSRNAGIDLFAERHSTTKYSRAMNAAEAIMGSVREYLFSDAYNLQQANNKGTLDAFYTEIGDRYITNADYSQKQFMAYILKTEYDVKEDLRTDKSPKDGVFISDDLIEHFFDILTPEQQKNLLGRLNLFATHIKKDAIETDPDKFKEGLYQKITEFVGETKKATELDLSFTEEHRRGAKERALARLNAQTEVAKVKSNGRDLYDKTLFGGYLEELKVFNEQKKTIVYKLEDMKDNKELKSKGAEKDDEHYGDALSMFVSEDLKKTYPPILADILFEYSRTNNGIIDKLNKAADWVLREDNDVKTEAKRLMKIYDAAKEDGSVPEQAMDLFLTYAAKFTLDSADPASATKKLIKEFNQYFEKIDELESIPVTDPALKAAHTDACEKVRSLLFMLENKGSREYRKFVDLVDAQKAYFVYAGPAYAAIETVVDTHPDLKDMDEKTRSFYKNGLREYFTGQLIEESQKALNNKDYPGFDLEKFKADATERIADGYKRDALMLKGDSVSNLDYDKKNIYPGAMTVSDFERALLATRNNELVKKYNELNYEQRQLFAISLYSMRNEMRGSQKVIFQTKDDDSLKKTRAQLGEYIKGRKIDLDVDYNKAVRALTAKSEGAKISGDVKLFFEAFNYVAKLEKRKEQLRPRDYSLMADSRYTTGQADKFRGEVVKGATGVEKNKKIMDNTFIRDKGRFFSVLEKHFNKDKKKAGTEGFFARIGESYRKFKNDSKPLSVIDSIKNLSASQQDLLIYVLQDRTVLDFSSAGKDENTKIVPHVNAGKRFKMFEKLTTDTGRYEAIKEASNPELSQKAMNTLLSFQLRDDRELSSGKLLKEDFVEESLNRVEAIDWVLLRHAVDFVEEIENERIKNIAVKQATNRILTEPENTKDKSVLFYRERVGEIKSAKITGEIDKFEDIILSAYDQDIKNGDFSEREMNDLLSGYHALNEKQKRLFFRALENREILDISQKNLYKDIVGIADRDFVNRKMRDELTDSFINAGGDVKMKPGSVQLAFLSLCSTQINDDMNFMDSKGIKWANKNLKVSNQWLVKDRKGILDWKLFQRALQFVTKAQDELDTNLQDEELYKALGDVKENGEMKIDRSNLRKNLHHTGARFMRFLARETFVNSLDSLGILETAADYAEFVVSTKTANFIHSEVNQILADKEEAEEEEKQAEEEAKEDEKEDAKEDKKDSGKEAEKDDKKEGVDNKDEKKEDKKEGEKKDEESPNYANPERCLKNLKDLAGQLNAQKDMIKSMFNEVKDIFNDGEDENDVMESVKKAREDELSKELEGVKVNEVTAYADSKDSITGKKWADYLLKGIKATDSLKDSLDAFLRDNPEGLEKYEGYIKDYLHKEINLKGLGEWYSEKEKVAAEAVQNFLVPESVQKFISDSVLALEKTGEWLTIAQEFMEPGIQAIKDLKDIWDSAKNIGELNEAKEKADEKEVADNEKIEGVDKSRFDYDLIKAAQKNNVALLKGSNDLTKSQQGRKILASSGSIAKVALKYAGVEGLDAIIDGAFKMADFIWKCMADKDTVYTYYAKAGNGIYDKLLEGRKKVKATYLGDKHMSHKNSEFHTKDNGERKLKSRGFELIKTGQGFERNDEIEDFLKIKMVNSLLFSASNFNPLEQPKILAEATLSVLGLESYIGKTDPESAEKVYRELKK